MGRGSSVRVTQIDRLYDKMWTQNVLQEYKGNSEEKQKYKDMLMFVQCFEKHIVGFKTFKMIDAARIESARRDTYHKYYKHIF